ncbi:GNAT family N-acetyltransferase [Streptomyces sp. NPDC005407]|uniref:GNAT family N-acetyltransferase n=1 Tax=Streptomyces sp. NPDC005407 TaxID=3155340 RepID=UPI0033B7A098
MAATDNTIPLASQHTGLGLVARRLQAGETGTALRLCPFEDVDAEVISRELEAEADYCWMGLFAPDGTAVAVHRAMRWHQHLLLKGVFVDDSYRGSGAALSAAFAIRDWARQAGYAGALAWVEPSKPEARLATRLRLRSASPLLHRYLIPLPSAGASARPRSTALRPTSGTLTVPLRDEGVPMVQELLGIWQEDLAGTRLSWVLDRSRLLLSGNPCRSVGDLSTLLGAVEETAVLTGATSVEIPFEAADLLAALSLAGRGARRLSRSPVNLGVLSFDGAGGHPGATVRSAAVEPNRHD